MGARATWAEATEPWKNQGKPRKTEENGAPDPLRAAQGHPRELQGDPKSSQEHSGRRPGVLRELPRALPEGPGRARERSKSSPGAPKSAPRSLRESQRAFQEPRLLQKRLGTAATPGNFDSSLHFVGASCQLATFLRRALRLLSYIRYATLATPRSLQHAGYATLRSLRHVGYATFAMLRSPCCVRYAKFATLRSLRSPRYVRYATPATLHAPLGSAEGYWAAGLLGY